jgi:C1A family cysteine protease/chitodextrinase
MKRNSNLKNYVNMKKSGIIFIEFLVIFLILGSSIAMAGNLPISKLSPINPDFVKYQQNNTLSGNGTSLHTGHIPPTVDLSHLRNISSSVAGSYPAYYDLRTLNKVTPVKDQGTAGSCWAHAGLASLESSLKPGETWDFSENNMKNVLSSAAPEGFDRDADGGGNWFMSSAYLARWSGPISESDDPYVDSSVYSPTELGLPVKKHVQNVYYLPYRNGPLDNDNIKWALQNYGAVTVSYYHDSNTAYYNSATYSYYYNGYPDISNHEVTIVGWDDNYDKNKFSIVPPGNGAFIVKNSWGTGWGDNGYLYISYYDYNLGYQGSAVFTAETTGNYNSIYQYDPLGDTNNLGYYSTTGWCVNQFTAKSNEVLKAVGFYTTDNDCSYQIYVARSGIGKSLVKSGTFSNAGYHTVTLDSGLSLSANQRFNIYLKLTNPNYIYPIAIEMPLEGYSSKATANTGQSLISPDGITWYDITTQYPNTNVCIKAFTTSVPTVLAASFSASTTSGSVPLKVQFTDKSTGTPTAWSWNFGDGYTSTEKNPLHTYSNKGIYSVNLWTSNAVSASSVTKNSYINALIEPPVAALSASTTSGKVPLTVQFTDQSTGSPTSWKWSFGDGTYSTSKNPVKTYGTAGKYDVTLTVDNSGGQSAVRRIKYVTVS